MPTEYNRSHPHSLATNLQLQVDNEIDKFVRICASRNELINAFNVGERGSFALSMWGIDSEPTPQPTSHITGLGFATLHATTQPNRCRPSETGDRHPSRTHRAEQRQHAPIHSPWNRSRSCFILAFLLGKGTSTSSSSCLAATRFETLHAHTQHNASAMYSTYAWQSLAVVVVVVYVLLPNARLKLTASIGRKLCSN